MFRAGWIAVLGGGAGFVSNDRELGLEEGGVFEKVPLWSLSYCLLSTVYCKMPPTTIFQGQSKLFILIVLKINNNLFATICMIVRNK